MFPRPLGIILMLGTIAYLFDVLVQFLAPELAETMSPLVVVSVTLSEVSMLAYLLVKGVKTSRPADTPTAVERELVET